MEEEEGVIGHQGPNTRGWDAELSKESTMTTRTQLTEADALISLQKHFAKMRKDQVGVSAVSNLF